MRTILTVAALAFLAQNPVYQIGNGVTPPRLVKEVKPNYMGDAMRRKVAGIVELKAVVLADGTVGDVTVTRSLDPDLDAEAIRVVKQWEFKPGTKDGTPVAVQVSVELSFTLRDGAPVYKPGAGVTAPVLVKDVKPEYPESAKQARIQGTVELEGVVETNGRMTGIRVTKGLDERLDQAAVKALGQWQFKPGQKDGEAVRVLVNIEMTFSVR